MRSEINTEQQRNQEYSDRLISESSIPAASPYTFRKVPSPTVVTSTTATRDKPTTITTNEMTAGAAGETTVPIEQIGIEPATSNAVDMAKISSQGVSTEQDSAKVTTTNAVETATVLTSDKKSRWIVPTDSPIIARFDKQGEYKGSATLRFGSSKGDTIVAVESGVVSFAGSVAGKNYVTIDHSHGLRSTYSVIEPLVNKGESVVAGQTIAVASGEIGLTARDDTGRYLDPEEFLPS